MSEYEMTCYAIELQRIISALCHGTPLRITREKLHHHKMAERYIARRDELIAATEQAIVTLEEAESWLSDSRVDFVADDCRAAAKRLLDALAAKEIEG